jgi:predicted TIM-barrel fold metal-dependent hydrolase
MIVDVQNHFLPPETIADELQSGMVDVSMTPPALRWHGVTLAGSEDMVNLELHLRVCEEAGLTHVMLSETMFLTPAREVLGIPTIESAGRANDAFSRIRDEHPDLVFPLGTVRPHDGRGAADEARRCVEELGFKGMAIDSSYGTNDLAFVHEPETYDFWEYVQEADVPVFMHPPLLAYGWGLMDRYRLDETVARPNQTALCVALMILSGFLDRFPGLKLVLPHMGGSLLMVLPRLRFGHRLGYEQFLGYQKAKNEHEPADYVKRNIWVDTMGFDPQGIRHAIEALGVERVLLGTDYGPLPMSPREHIELITDELDLPEESQDRILGLNAKELFGLPDPA